MMPEGVELKIRVPHEPLIIRSDHFRLTQVCTNFINNAVKFTAKGYIEIGYELSADGKSILISVKVRVRAFLMIKRKRYSSVSRN